MFLFTKCTVVIGVMDEIDRVIIAALQQNGRVSLSEIGRRIGLSHVSVRRRLNNLSKNILKVTVGLNARKMGFHLAIVSAEVETPKRLQEIIRVLLNCPRVIFLAKVTGAYNLMAIMIAENMETLNAMVEHCSVRAYEGIRRSEVVIAEAPIIPEYLPVRMVVDRCSEIAPCGMECGECIRYKHEGCLACPATKYYRGPL